MIGAAFIGAGFIAYLHQLALRITGRASLAAIASNTLCGAQHRARIFGADAYTFDALDGMLARDDVQIVFVLSPNALHCEHALAAIRAGKHVVIEKPLALTVAEAQQIATAAELAGVGVGYAENQVFSPVVMQARALVADGAVGAVRRVVGFCGHAGPPQRSWFWNPRWAGGGAGFDMGSHTVETSLFLAGMPVVDAVTQATIDLAPSGIDGRVAARLATAQGIELDVTSSFLESAESMWYAVEGDRGTLRVVFAPAPFAQRITIADAGGAAREVKLAHAGEALRIDRYVGSMGYVAQLDHFLDCFETGKTPRESASDGVRVVQILNAIYAAAGRGDAFRVADVPMDRMPVDLWRHAP